MVTIDSLHGVNTKVTKQLDKLDIHTIDDMLFHLPLRYEDRTKIKQLADLKVGDHTMVEGIVQAAEVKYGKKRSLICMLEDNTGTIMLRFFHFYPAQRELLQPGTKLRCFGEVRQGYHCLELVHPQYEPLDYSNTAPDLAEHLTPIYRSSSKLNQSVFHSLIDQIFAKYDIIDYIPENLRTQFNLLPLPEALKTLHHPTPEIAPKLADEKHPARMRLIFEELLAHHLSMYSLRASNNEHSAACLDNAGILACALIEQLSFQLTNSQQRVIAEINADLRSVSPMQRLLQGDVGSGKTVVAAISALQAIESGYQVAVMAPTELLSEQHVRTFGQWLEPLDIKFTWLTSSLTKKKREQVLATIASGQVSLIIGTHALFQKDVEFSKLGLIIVDEQHRFGVHQRLALRNKG
ncbi:MAG: DEAD/DEAH box helicase, partial [Candidatus Marithrix sp.]|nr:DEAD/DEAH box helicase [Candidatus Marithrix sp.]